MELDFVEAIVKLKPLDDIKINNTTATEWTVTAWYDEWVINIEKHGGNPTAKGVGFLAVTRASRLIPRLIVKYPDGETNYLNLSIFNDYFEFYNPTLVDIS